MATVRYIVFDVPAAVAFYVEGLGFEVRQNFGPNMAILVKGDLTLWTAGPGASASRPMPDGRVPEPGGWNRFVLEVDDLEAAIATLKAHGTPFRNEIVSGPGGRQILVADPSGNVIELFQAGS
jgi:catechol 2,3-dioxygenase-like lactoylglutathione lyase family enzyme